MNTSDDGVKAICAEEGLRLEAYQDVAGVWTVGYGHTGPTVQRGMRITEDQAVSLLRLDLARFEQAVAAAVRRPLHQHEFDALVSLTFNVGTAAFTKSTLVNALNDGEFSRAAAQFTEWTKAGGVHQPGLLRRRTRELLRFVGYL